MSIQVEPDSQGNITITIKLVIASAGANAGVINTEIVSTVEEEVNESLHSENLLRSDSSDSSTVIDGENKDEDNGTNEAEGARYSLRSLIRIDTATNNGEDDKDDSDSEVDYELSQQVRSMGF